VITNNGIVKWIAIAIRARDVRKASPLLNSPRKIDLAIWVSNSR
jgi:hypothetical protein